MGPLRSWARQLTVFVLAGPLLVACGEPSDPSGRRSAPLTIDGRALRPLFAGDVAVWPGSSGTSVVLTDMETSDVLVSIDLSDDVAYVDAASRGGVVDVVALTCARPNPSFGQGDLDHYCNDGPALHHVEVAVDGWSAGTPVVLGGIEEVPWAIGATGPQPVVVTGSSFHRRDDGEWTTIPRDAGSTEHLHACPTAAGLVALDGAGIGFTTTTPDEAALAAPAAPALRLLPPERTDWEALPVPSITGNVIQLTCWADGFIVSATEPGPRPVLWFVTGGPDGFDVREMPLPGYGSLPISTLGEGELPAVTSHDGEGFLTFVLEPTGDVVRTVRTPTGVPDDQLPDPGAVYGRRGGEVVRIDGVGSDRGPRVEVVESS